MSVEIRDAAGKKILDTVSEGPFLFARVPAGKNTISAATETGGVKRHTVRVAAKGHQRVVFEWTK